MTPPISLALGPLLFHWPADKVADFYAAIADEAPLDRVYLGEAVCGKRLPRMRKTFEAAAERLARAGKEVVLTSLAMPATAGERRVQEGLLGAGDGLVEINDVSALMQITPGRPFVAGPLLNIYNEAAAAELMGRGCVRLCGNVELSLDALGAIHRGSPTLELELFAFGRLPLALAGRCHHARLHDLHKDSCQFVCERDTDGLAVRTLDGRPFLALNGVQVMSHGVQLASPPVEELFQAGIAALRLSPQDLDMAEVGRGFRDYCDGKLDGEALRSRLMQLKPPGEFVDGYPRGLAGWRSGAET
jgi:collagenase-like PrtC family protease